MRLVAVRLSNCVGRGCLREGDRDGAERRVSDAILGIFESQEGAQLQMWP